MISGCDVETLTSQSVSLLALRLLDYMYRYNTGMCWGKALYFAQNSVFIVAIINVETELSELCLES